MVKRTAPRKKPSRSRLGLGLAALGFLIMVIIIGKFVQIAVDLNQPMFPGSPAEEKTSSFNGQNQFNVIVSAGDIFVIFFDPQQNNAAVVQIPDDIYINLPFQFGRWQIGSIYQLGQAESPPMGTQLFKDSISSSLGVPLDGYLVFDQDKRDAKEFIEHLRKSFMGGFLPLEDGYTDLSRVEYWRFIHGLKGVRSDKINYYNLGDEDVTQPTNLSDGSQASSFDNIKLNSFIQRYLTDSSIKAEELTIGVFNATDHPGMAEKATRIVNNMGGRVVLTVSTPVRLQKSLVIGKDSYTLKRLVDVFAPSCNHKAFQFFGSSQDQHCLTSDPNLNLSRVDVNIILGEDYFLRYNQR